MSARRVRTPTPARPSAAASADIRRVANCQPVALSGDAGVSGLASALKDGTGGGVSALAQMAMSIVYPTLKPMLEASIRKITVKVLWKEGIQKRDLSAIQYVTRPMRGDAITAAAAASAGLNGGMAPGAAPAATTRMPTR